MGSVLSWTDFYQELANKVLSYKNNRDSFVRIVEQSHEGAGLKYSLYWDGHRFKDIDPFTFFGTFNKGLKDKNRIELLKQYKKYFDISAELPSDFSGIPVLNNMRAWFMADTPEDVMKSYWDLFEVAIKYADGDKSLESDVESLFDKVVSFEGTLWNITMGLFWIRPFTFINLDTTNREKIKEIGLFDGKFPSGKDYLELCENIKNQTDSDNFPYSSFPEFSFQSWITSSSDRISNATFLKWFSPILVALRDLGGSGAPIKVREQIIKNENLSNEEITATRGKSNVNKFENEVAWARKYLVDGGYIDNSKKGIWQLTEDGWKVEMTKELASSIFINSVNKNKKLKSGDSNSDYVLSDSEVKSVRYWLYAPGNNADKWDEFREAGIMAIGWGAIGDLSNFKSKEEMKKAMKAEYDPNKSYMNDAHATWQFANEMKEGDVIFVKKGMYQIIGRGIVTSDYYFDGTKDDFCNIRNVNWTESGKWDHPGHQAVMKTLTDITSYTDYVEALNNLFENEIVEEQEKDEADYPEYTSEDFLSEVYMDKEKYNTLVSLVRNKKNVILQGAPGVGKTYAAKRLAYSMMGCMDKDRVMMIQFHQSYSYEDFIMGYRPSENGFDIKEGAFYKFCNKAKIDYENEYFFIIDEINRGNLSKIFGELFMLIESDKRGVELDLLYKNEKFYVPKNVYIIGMMNTADRSLAMMDYALRRRFAFFEISPGFDTDGFKKYKESLNDTKFNNLINCIENLNNVIEADESLGEGFRIGHSYFCNLKDVSYPVLSRIVEFELVPLLKEYWFDEKTKAKDWIGNLRDSIK